MEACRSSLRSTAHLEEGEGVVLPSFSEFTQHTNQTHAWLVLRLLYDSHLC